MVPEPVAALSGHRDTREVRHRSGANVLGHAKADVTQIYAEHDLQRAAKIMGEVGQRDSAESDGHMIS